MFDAKGPMGFAESPEKLLAMLGLLNSTPATRIMKMLAPTMDFKIGHVLSIPSRLTESDMGIIAEQATIAVAAARAIWSMDETAFGFSGARAGCRFDETRPLGSDEA